MKIPPLIPPPTPPLRQTLLAALRTSTVAPAILLSGDDGYPSPRLRAVCRQAAAAR
ncbi:hypothetical protein ACU4GI_01565 [Cupriavidus basilensis]|uniref:hypothetical protein n=1 Tax=Cupriavidus sp. SK-3 TaxID=1470558 RepID=UPI000B1192C1|nr:hypothetical protein [Cupriavidus sp. SK-3]